MRREDTDASVPYLKTRFSFHRLTSSSEVIRFEYMSSKDDDVYRVVV
jgi:hypothetical protein